jgi:mono/diheme cytochrome c family protein
MKKASIIILIASLTASCDLWMESQPKYHEYEPAELFRNGRVLQEPVSGTVARGDLARAREAAQKPALTAQLLHRGHRQYDVFCAPCHDRVGAGNGMIVQRGMPKPPSLHIDRLRSADDQYFFDVTTNGHGIMYAFADRVRPRDRWAIVAYVRALQLSQHASPDDLPEDVKQRLTAKAPQ